MNSGNLNIMAKKESLSRKCKEGMVDEIISSIEKHPNFFITNYMGLSVANLEGLRKNLSKASAQYFVVKNSVLKVVFDKMKMPEASGMIESGMGISLSGADAIATSKALVTFAKDNNKFKVRAAYIDGKFVTAETIAVLASLPSREVLLSRVVGGMKAPISGFVGVLSGVLRKFVYTVDAIKVSKEKV